MGENRKGVLALADGTVFEGIGFGAPLESDSPSLGEVVFNTSMYGYQEILTDPSYAGQVMTFSYPHIGNVGCNEQDVESSAIHVRGVVVRNLSRIPSNFRSQMTLHEYLSRNNVLGLFGVDTRALVSHIRDHGAQMCALALRNPNLKSHTENEQLIEAARRAGSMEGADFVKEVTCCEPYEWTELPWSLDDLAYGKVHADELWTRPHVVALDCGIKRNILRLLLQSGFRVTVVPATTSAQEIVAMKPDAIFLSNGPGDPSALDYIVKTVSQLLGTCPLFGICLGHQILGLVAGGTTYKLKFGHRGANHPVMDLRSGKVEITTQNHGFAVDAKTLPPHIEVTHMNLNDQTVSGLEWKEKRAFSVQYHPEASSGPHDSAYLFNEFYDRVMKG